MILAKGWQQESKQFKPYWAIKNIELFRAGNNKEDGNGF